MRDQLKQYVDLLFAGVADCEDIKQEILLNTLDRYDDLIAEGKVPEAAYRLAITGIGDVNEILGIRPQSATADHTADPQKAEDDDTPLKKLLRAIAVGMYILCPIPLLLLADTGLEILGVCILLAIVAVATVIMVVCARKDHDDEDEKKDKHDPNRKLKKSIGSLIWTVGVIVYFVVSGLTGAWHITWLIFLITGAAEGLADAIVDLKEARKYES